VPRPEIACRSNITLQCRVLDGLRLVIYRWLVRASPTVALDAHATATLRYIRASMDAAGSVGVSGTAGITMGCVGIAAALVASTPALRAYWLVVWLAAAAIAAIAGGALMARQAARQGFTLFGAPVRKFVLCLAPGLFAGVVMTCLLWRVGALHAIPASWLVLYGCALVATSACTRRVVGIMGGLFVLLGLLAFVLPDAFQTLALGAGFGGLHLIFGLLIRRRAHGS
jgi:hypothetical protein